MVTVTALEPVPPEFVAVTVTLNVPATVGIPLTRPVEAFTLKL